MAEFEFNTGDDRAGCRDECGSELLQFVVGVSVGILMLFHITHTLRNQTAIKLNVALMMR